jgi:DivIVA domain-containing protein
MADPRASFDLVLRGYHRAQVDAYLGALEAAIARLRHNPNAAGLPVPEVFDIVLRGYDRAQVDDRVAELVAEGQRLSDRGGD